jgi:catechol 2,3-dioxygenase-like lactoylglutathione lyase family enzyme
LCFLTDENVENVLQAFHDAKIEVSLSESTESSLHTNNVKVLEGAKIVDRTGAVGRIRSVYVRDPDGNLIEYVISHSPPSDY